MDSGGDKWCHHIYIRGDGGVTALLGFRGEQNGVIAHGSTKFLNWIIVYTGVGFRTGTKLIDDLEKLARKGDG